MPNSYSFSIPYPFPEQIQRSLHILGFPDGVAPESVKELNKRYHLLALKFHPDKATVDGGDNHSDVDTTERFKEINDAHKRVKDYFYSNESDGSCGGGFGHEINSYDSILQMFIQTILVKMSTANGAGGGNIETNANQAVHSLINMIITKGIQSGITMFRTMDKQTSLTMYEILSKNQDLFGISREIMEELTTIVEEKTSDDLVVRLNPSLLDMLLDRVYILHECEQTYYIPLWHTELHFNKPGNGEVIVLCEPELPDHVSLDDHNNLFISLDVNVLELFTRQVVPVYIDDEIKNHHIVFYLHACDVTLRSDTRQCVLLRGVDSVPGCGGIAKCSTNTSDIYKVSVRANVYANVRLVSGV